MAAKFAAGMGLGVAVGYCLPKVHALSPYVKPVEDAISAAMPKPALTLRYFDVQGRAEPTRLTLAAAGVPFTDVRVKPADWPALKPSTKMGQLPDLSIDGYGTFAQSGASLRYAGRVGGLYPSEPVDAIAVDEVLGLVDDVNNTIVLPLYAAVYMPGAPKSAVDKCAAAVGNEVSTAKLPKLLKIYETLLEQSGTGFFVGGKPTIADVAVAAQVNMFTDVLFEGHFLAKPPDLEPYPKLTQLVKRVNALPGVKEWHDAHPPAMPTANK
jgi:glutathione S-transferase